MAVSSGLPYSNCLSVGSSSVDLPSSSDVRTLQLRTTLCGPLSETCDTAVELHVGFTLQYQQSQIWEDESAYRHVPQIVAPFWVTVTSARRIAIKPPILKFLLKQTPIKLKIMLKCHFKL